MGKQAFAAALETMADDAEIAERVSGGDFAGLEGELTSEEQTLLSAAAGELDDDVAGFRDRTVKFPAGFDIANPSGYTEPGRVTFTGPGMGNAFDYLDTP